MNSIALLRAWPGTAAQIDARYDREVAAIVASAHTGYAEHCRAEREEYERAELTRMKREGWERYREMCNADPLRASVAMTYMEGILDLHDEHLAALEARYAAPPLSSPPCRDCSIPEGDEEKKPLTSSPDTPTQAQLHGPSDPKDRAEWEALVRRYQKPRPRKQGCGSIAIGQQFFDFSKHRTLHVHCGCWGCGTCGPKVATLWHCHLLPTLEAAEGVWRVQADAGKPWEALARRLLRAGAQHVRFLCPDGSFEVLTTVWVEGAVQLDPAQIEATLAELISTLPLDETGGKRRVTTSKGWKMAVRRGAKRTDESRWETRGKGGATPEQVQAVLQEEGVAYSVAGYGRRALCVTWKATDQAMGQRIWERVFRRPLARAA